MTMQAPFFSALNERNVIYQPSDKSFGSQVHASLSHILNQNPVLKTVAYASYAAINVGIASMLPPVVSLPFTLASTYLAYEHINFSKALKRKTQFLKDTQGLATPTDPHPMIKDRQHCTFNHIFSFVKSSGIWWYAPRIHVDEAPSWKKLYIDKLPLAKIKQSEMEADGANIMVILKQKEFQKVYYKKIIKEERKKDAYIVTNIAEEPFAIDTWFSLPIANFFKPQQWMQRLRLPRDAPWAMSHSGEYKNVVVDSRGIKHINLGATTFFEFKPNMFPPVIRLHDPYVERGSECDIILPENVVPVTDKIEASASFIFIFCRNCDDENQIFLLSRHIDYDSLGLNPIIGYTHDPKITHKRLMPFPSWQKHSLPHGITSSMALTVVQCGKENHSIEIRLHQKEDPSQFFYKNMNESKWKKWDQVRRQIIPLEEEHSINLLPHRLSHQSNKTFSLNGRIIKQVESYSFNLLIDFCPVILTRDDNKKIHLYLYRYKNMIGAYFNISKENWFLVADPHFPEDAEILGKAKCIPVIINVKEEILTIHPLENTISSLTSCIQNKINPAILSAMKLSRKQGFSQTTSTVESAFAKATADKPSSMKPVL